MKIPLPEFTVLRGKERSYRILGTLSDKGGFSFTYLAEEVGDGRRRFTVKELYIADRCVREGDGTTVRWDSDFQKFRDSFESEARFVSMCRESPNIVKEFECFHANNTVYLILEHIDGIQVNKFTEGILLSEPGRINGLMADLCRALHFIHTRNSICHFDLKPNNVMIEKGTERLVLIDFGSSVHFDSDGIKTVAEHIDTNSRGYTAPEIINSLIDPKDLTIDRAVKADVYSLGGVAYFLLTRKHPPENAVDETVRHKLGILPSTVRAACPGLIEAIRRSIVYDPDKRLPDVAAFARLLGVELDPGAKEPDTIPTELSDDREIATELAEPSVADLPDISTDENENPTETPSPVSRAPIQERIIAAPPVKATALPKKSSGKNKGGNSSGEKPFLYVVFGLVPILLCTAAILYFREPAKVSRPEPSRITHSVKKPHNTSKTAVTSEASEISALPDTLADPAGTAPPANTEEYRFPNGNIWYGPLYEGKPDGIGELHAFHTTTLGDSTLYDGWYIRNAVFENGLFCSGDIYDPAGNYRYTYIP